MKWESFTIKDYIQLGVLIGSMVSFYLISIKDLEGRIIRLETQEVGISADLQEIKSDIKQLLREKK